MRIDEFKALPSGSISAADRARFCFFGFDISSSSPVPVAKIIRVTTTGRGPNSTTGHI